LRLTASVARELREFFRKRPTVRDLMEAVGVSDQTIKDVLNFETSAGAGGPRLERSLEHER
jgi:hypothetical protein